LWRQEIVATIILRTFSVTNEKPKETKSCCQRPEIDALACKVGSFIEYWGFKQIHGRIWTHLYLSNTPLDAGTLIERLGVSKALVSISLKDLLEYDVILPSEKTPGCKQSYVINPDIMGVISDVLRKREKVLLNDVQNALSILKTLPEECIEDNSLCPHKISHLDKMVGDAQVMLDMFLAVNSEATKGWRLETSEEEKA
jgi:DNA-binding transcriptional regulator GbsR (MarR family)